MKDYKIKFRKIFVPCILIILAALIISLFVQWLLYDKHIGANSTINNIWIGVVFGVFVFLLSYRFTKRLEKTTGDLPWVYALLTMFIFGIPLACQNAFDPHIDDKFIRLALSDVKEVNEISEIDTQNLNTYYKVKDWSLDLRGISIYESWKVTSSRGIENGTYYSMYLSCPIKNNKDSSDIQFWLSVYFDRDTNEVLGQISAEKIFQESEPGFIEWFKHFDFKIYPYLYIDKSSKFSEGFHLAAKKSTMWNGMNDVNILRLKDQSPRELLMIRIKWMTISFVFASIAFAFLLIFPNIKTKYLTN